MDSMINNNKSNKNKKILQLKMDKNSKYINLSNLINLKDQEN